jgi:hypothetical protein
MALAGLSSAPPCGSETSVVVSELHTVCLLQQLLPHPLMLPSAAHQGNAGISTPLIAFAFFFFFFLMLLGESSCYLWSLFHHVGRVLLWERCSQANIVSLI